MRKILVSDFTIKEVPHGGSEWVNQVLIDKFNLEFQYSHELMSWDSEAFYIISNISLMKPELVREIPKLNYIIIENDYKICPSRHPWMFKDSRIPLLQRTNYDLYENAKAVFVQTTDHLNVYKLNDVVGNFINLSCSIWSDSDLDLLKKLNTQKVLKNGKYAVYSTSNWIKNTNGAIEFCKKNNFPVQEVKNNPDRLAFLDELGSCEYLVFFPIARETFCRLVVEAKCMGVKVITSKNYGASLEKWFDMSADDMLKYLKIKTDKNLKTIESYLWV